MNKRKSLLIFCALLAGGMGFYLANLLKPLTGDFVFWQHTLREPLAASTNFIPHFPQQGAPLTWMEQWTVQIDQLAPWVLAYQVPAAHHLGRLRFYQTTVGNFSRQKDFDHYQGWAVELRDITSFSWHLLGTPFSPMKDAQEEQCTDLSWQADSLPAELFTAPFILEMVIGQKSAPPQTLRLHLPNLQGIRDKYGRWWGDQKFARLQNSGHTGAIEGGQTFSFVIWQVLHEVNQEQFDPSEMISREDHLVLCQRVDDQCRVIGKSRCDQCRYGYFPVVGNRFCPQGGTYACGPNFCGQANWPACWRGFEATKNEQVQLCQDESTAGYCYAGRTTMCRDGILFCW